MRTNKRKVIGGFVIVLFAIIAISLHDFQKTAEREKIDLSNIEDENLQLEVDTEDVDLTQYFDVISINEARKMLYVLYVDIRPEEAYRQDHIINSVHITKLSSAKTDNIKNLIIIAPKTDITEKPDLISGIIESLPQKFNIYVLRDGFAAWQDVSAPTITQGNPNSPSDHAKISLAEPRDLEKIITSENIHILDVRRSGNYASAHIPYAHHIPLDEIEQRRNELPLDKTIYVYGADMLQSFYAGTLLFDLGFFDTKTISGGFKSWSEYGYTTDAN